MKYIASLLFLGLGTAASAQQNFIKIEKTDKESDIIRKAAHITPSPRQLRWQQLELTAFFHFGINTFTDKEWGDGKEDISIFNPAELDAEQWIRTVREAGFKQVIITAKHHDGFCLWPSKYTEHSIKNTPYKNGKGDIVKEVAEACKKYNIGFGVYLSPWDRNSAFYGSDAYNTYFINQLTELLTQYGKVDEVWFDGANGEGPNGKKQEYDFDNWYKLIRKLQPQAVIAVQGPDVRWVGTESGSGRETEWSVLPMAEMSQEKIAATSQKEVNVIPAITGSYKDQDRGSRSKLAGASGLVWYPAETDVSIRPGWFYHATEDDKVKSPDRLMEIYFTSVGRNGVLLLNIPPDKHGLISEADQSALKGFASKMRKTFSNNFAGNAQVHSSQADGTIIMEYTLPKMQTFDVLALQENIKVGQRIEKFKAEYFDGRNWKTFTSGTTVGYKRLLHFPQVTSSRIRLTIEQSRLKPELAFLGLYRLDKN